jgi:hypothetical protein
MGDWKTRFSGRKRPGQRETLGRAITKINGVIAMLLVSGFAFAAHAHLQAAVVFGFERNHAAVAQKVNEELSTSFAGGGIGLASAAFVAGLAFVVFEAPMRFYRAVFGCGSAYVSLLYFGGPALGQ